MVVVLEVVVVVVVVYTPELMLWYELAGVVLDFAAGNPDKLRRPARTD